MDRPVEPWADALDVLVTPAARRELGRARVPDVALHATDLDWRHGSGPAVHGPAAARSLTFAGRPALLDHLSGPGPDQLRASLRS